MPSPLVRTELPPTVALVGIETLMTNAIAFNAVKDSMAILPLRDIPDLP